MPSRSPSGLPTGSPAIGNAIRRAPRLRRPPARPNSPTAVRAACRWHWTGDRRGARRERQPSPSPAGGTGWRPRTGPVSRRGGGEKGANGPKAGKPRKKSRGGWWGHPSCPFAPPKSFHNRWRTPAVLALAAKAYGSRLAASGTLDPSCINGLFDAMVAAGCREVDLLDHLGRAEPHMPGCWGIDVILAKDH